MGGFKRPLQSSLGISGIDVTAGIGILEKASPIYQDYFLTAGCVAMLSVGNMLGRIGWLSLFDVIGRKNAYRLYLGVGALMYLTITLMDNSNKLVFIIATIVILSFYGAGFATVPAYLRDLFGTFQVAAIHGRLLTAWAVAIVCNELIRLVASRSRWPGCGSRCRSATGCTSCSSRSGSCSAVRSDNSFCPCICDNQLQALLVLHKGWMRLDFCHVHLTGYRTYAFWEVLALPTSMRQRLVAPRWATDFGLNYPSSGHRCDW